MGTHPWRDGLARVQAEIAAATHASERDHRRASVLDTLEALQATDFASFSIPAHKQGRGIDAETRRVLGEATIEFLQRGMEGGMYVEGASGQSLQEIRVVDL